MNHSIHSADRATHLKIVVVALVAGIAVAGFGISARTNIDYTQTAHVIKAGKPVAVTSSDTLAGPLRQIRISKDSKMAAFGRPFVLHDASETFTSEPSAGAAAITADFKPNGARDGTRTRDLRRDRAAL